MRTAGRRSAQRYCPECNHGNPRIAGPRLSIISRNHLEAWQAESCCGAQWVREIESAAVTGTHCGDGQGRSRKCDEAGWHYSTVVGLSGTELGLEVAR